MLSPLDLVTPTYREAILNSPGIVGYFRLGEASGSYVDSVGTATGTNNGTTTRNVAGGLAMDFNGAVTLDGSSGYVDFGDVWDFTGTLPMSIALWANAAVMTASNRLIDKNAGGASGSWGMRTNATSVQFTRTDATSTDTVTANGSFTVGKWAFCVATYDGITMRAQFGGENGLRPPNSLVSSKSMANNATTVKLGRQANLAASFWNGSIDELAVWNRAIAPSEIEELYRIGRGY